MSIRKTIDEEIDGLVEWHKNYPDIKVERRYKDKPISTETIEKLKELAKSEGVEFSEIIERYRKIQSYNEYVISRDIKGKLTDEQRKKCKDGNLGGRFGFTTEIEELAEKYKIKPEQVASIIKKFNTIDNFIEMYRNGKLSDEEVIECNELLINNLIDIDFNPNNERYSKLVCAIFGMPRYKAKNDIIMYSSKTIDEVLHTLNPREEAYIRERYGLDNGTVKTLKECGSIFNVTIEMSRQIEANALRNLRHPAKEKLIKPRTFNGLRENEFITDEEKTELSDLENEVWKSNLIFKHESLDDINFDTTRLSKVLDVCKNLEKRRKQEIEQRKTGKNKERFRPEKIKTKIASGEIILDEILIEYMDFSVRTFNCLKRAGIHTLKDLYNLTYENLGKIRNLGQKGIKEIISKLGAYGLTIEKEATEIEKIRRKKEILKGELKKLGNYTTEAAKLLATYTELIGDDKRIDTDNGAPDLKGE